MANIRILSIDGGGIRGIFPLIILRELQKRLDRPITDYFHLMAGTSTGGLITLGLAKLMKEKDPVEAFDAIIDLYLKRGKEIFSQSLWRKFRAATQVFVDEKYDAFGLEAILEEIFGDMKLSDIESDILVPAYNLESRHHYFRTWRARGEFLDNGDTPEDPRAHDFFIKDVARATTAAPSIFEPTLIKNELGEEFPLVDGGIFANDPSTRAVARARFMYHHSHDILILSMGTGIFDRKIEYRKAKDWLRHNWVRGVVGMVHDGQRAANEEDLQTQFGDNYIRIDQHLSAAKTKKLTPSTKFSDASTRNVEALVALANDWVAENQDTLDMIAEKLQEPIATKEMLKMPDHDFCPVDPHSNIHLPPQNGGWHAGLH